MKIIKYKQDGKTAVLKTVRNLQKLCSVHGKDFYCSPVEKDERLTDYYYQIGGTVDLLDRLDVNAWNTPEYVKELLRDMTEETLSGYAPNKVQIIERLKTAVKNKKWTSNGDALFCESVGERELADAIRRNRKEYRERQRKADAEESERKERERVARMEAEKQERLELLNEAKTSVLSEQPITAKQFELLAEDCGIALPAKLVGWIRKYCKSIHITKQPEPPKGLEWVEKYRVSYRYTNRHKSTSVFKYAERIAEYLGL
ncbi:MAG: hypothetical protein NC548_40465 [Lachnospiraceae bacterium]|nr:hypothetical protein [Lachnospiraceae bacterium]